MNYKYEEVMPKLRQAGIVATGIQLLVLFMQSSTLGFGGVLFQLLFLLTECGILTYNFVKKIDGPHELREVLQAEEPKEKVEHAAVLFGPFLLALLVHWTAFTFDSGLSTFFFFAADCTAMAAGFVGVCLDIIGGLSKKSK
ncbi:hypothetical protein QR680_011400 [Steinernema hermaphroditum]|uniref:DUF7087 domain-containing protein n=1 Tax=Steinernema hermaphroditum TaxID=289476 RepID=A0AA39IV07_9BILA|nr:hypothetical protein QR680_011400 [Steinernema hermaphroditum]